MTVNEIEKMIKSKASSGIQPGLKNIKALCSSLGNPQSELKCIHIAGTNGKGSVCAFTEAILKESGLKFCCYTSPAVFSKTEQFRINGRPASIGKLYAAAHAVISKIDDLNNEGIFPTEFEIETAIALKLFHDENSDICIIECGMGGESDATNVIENTLVSAITPISLEHTKFLGNSIYEIARNKSGIIKKNSIVISAEQPQEAQTAISERCAKLNITPVFIDNSLIKNIELKGNCMYFQYCGTAYKSNLLGIHQAENAALAVEICKKLSLCGFQIQHKYIEKGISNAENSGRFDIISSEPLVVLDGAHNVHGAKALCQTVKTFFSDKECIIIMGVFSDKDYDGILKVLSKISTTLIAVMPNNPRALDSQALCDCAEQYFLHTKHCSINQAAALCTDKKKLYCVCGSLSYLCEFKELFLNSPGNFS